MAALSELHRGSPYRPEVHTDDPNPPTKAANFASLASPLIKILSTWTVRARTLRALSKRRSGSPQPYIQVHLVLDQELLPGIAMQLLMRASGRPPEP